MSRRVCIVGLDGVNDYVATKLMSIHYKVKYTLVSTIPPYTPPAWTSILTGVNPGWHGVYGFLGYKNGSVSLNLSWDVMYPRLFEMLAMHGLKSVVVNVPLSCPFNALTLRDNYIVVSDWACPRQAIWPSRLHLKFREYLVEPPHNWYDYSDIREYISKIHEYSTTRMNLYLELLERNDWSLYFIVFSETDWLLHKLPELLDGKNTSLVQPIFNLIKKFIGRAAEVCDLTLVVSDHGFEKKYWKVNINAVFHRMGLLKHRYIFPLRKRSRQSIDNACGGCGSIPAKIFYSMTNAIASIMPRRYVSLLVHRLKGRLSISKVVDIRSSSAFMVEAPTWGVYVRNTQYIELVRKLLSRIPGIKRVYMSKEIFCGPYTNYAPQLIVVPETGVRFGDGPYRNIIEQIYQGDHDLNGAFIAIGDDVREEHSGTGKVIVYDVVPTVLYYLGLPLPHPCDGRPLKDIFVGEHLCYREKYNYLAKFKVLRLAKGAIKSTSSA